MALQTQNLVMVGLDVKGEGSPSPQLPRPVDGIHLRWAFKRELGFPWYGCYLFRRQRIGGDPIWLSYQTKNLRKGPFHYTEWATPIGGVHSDRSFFLTDDFPRPRLNSGDLEFDLDGRQYIRFTIPPTILARRVIVNIGFRQNGEIRVITFSGNRPSTWSREEIPAVETIVKGRAGQVKSVELEFDLMSAVEIRSGPAALVDLGYVPVDEDAEGYWQPIPDFSYPMCLPLTQPDYPCTPGRNEDLDRARQLARKRILYGRPEAYTAAPSSATYDRGVISVDNGSAVVMGRRTDWSDELSGMTLQVSGEPTAYTIAQVIGPDKLILSRSYGGNSNAATRYQIWEEDAFAQLHDYLVHLVRGGPAAGPMVHRSVPIPVHDTGAVGVGRNSPVVNGTGTNWGAELTGLAFQLIGATRGTVEVEEIASNVAGPNVVGTGTHWDTDLVGLAFRVIGEETVYTIRSVDPSAQRLTLDRNYERASGAGRPYIIYDQTTYAISRVDSPTQLTLDRNYLGATRTTKAYRFVSRLQPAQTGSIAPLMPRQYPLDLMLLTALHPALAQMLGLYWVDRTADSNRAYDYLIVADYTGALRGLAPEDIPAQLNGFKKLEGYIVFNQKIGRASPLPAPSGVTAHPLSTAGAVPDHGQAKGRNSVGLRWDLDVTARGTLLPGRSIMYHLWRESPEGPGVHNLITIGGPVLPTKPRSRSGLEPEGPPDWPSTPFNAIDSGLPDGQYSYQVSGVDLFGRHSEKSIPATVELLDRFPPPPPTGIEAYALDPDDPTVLKDQAYNVWRTANPRVIGLRVGWSWTHRHMQQAPETEEFRIYYQPRHLNVLLGKTGRVTQVSATESAVQTDIPNRRSADSYVGAKLRIGTDVFSIVSSEAGNPLGLNVHSGPTYTVGTISVTSGSADVDGSNTNWTSDFTGLTLRINGERTAYTILNVVSPNELTLDRSYQGPTYRRKAYAITGKTPRTDAPCTIVLPPDHTAGTVSMVNGSPMVTGDRTEWGEELVGRKFMIAGESKEYEVRRIDPATQRLTLDRGYEDATGNRKSYLIRHPLLVDYTVQENWEDRVHVVPYDDHFVEKIPPLRTPAGKPLMGRSAAITTASSRVIALDGDPDLSEVPFNALVLWLENDTHLSDRKYRILAVDDQGKTVTIDVTGGAPNLSGGSSPWIIGPPVPLRHYEVFFPALHADPGESFAPSLEEPVIYAQIGISAADDKAQIPDERTRGNLSNRRGSEGSVGGPAAIFRVRREPPPKPEIPPFDSDKVYATPADYHSRSFYTYRWVRAQRLKTHIFRALDDSLFQVDWSWRKKRLDPGGTHNGDGNPPFLLSASDSEDLRRYFPVELRPDPQRPDSENDARTRRRDDLVDKINALNNISSSATREEARAAYQELTNDALRVLAGLPGNERAFTQLTIQPLDPEEPDTENPGELRWRNRPGPDNLPDFPIDPNLRIYIDTLDGRSTSRYFYRAGYVDGAHNRSEELSLSSPPVYLPNIVPPRAPVITKVLGGDRQIILRWASNREQDLAEYRIYRTGDKNKARDLRLMDLMPMAPVPAADPAARPAEVAWTDNNVPALVNHTYRLVAVDAAGNVSVPSTPVAARAYDTRLPEPPQLTLVWVDRTGTVRAEVTWTSPHEVLIQRRRAGGPWFDLPDRKPAGTHRVRDEGSDPNRDYGYRALVRSTTGAINRGAPQLLAAASP